MKKIAIVILILVASVSVAEANKWIKKVKEGRFNGYGSLTLEEVMQANFDGKWDYYLGSGGEHVVQFKGKMRQSMHDKWVAMVHNDMPLHSPTYFKLAMQEEEIAGNFDAVLKKSCTGKYESLNQQYRIWTCISTYWAESKFQPGSDTLFSFIATKKDWRLTWWENTTWVNSSQTILKVLYGY